MQAFDLWRCFEQVGGALVVLGVIGQVWAASTEPEEQIGEWSSMLLTVGLMVSIASLLGAGDRLGTSIATVIAHVG